MASSSPRWPQTGPKGFQDRSKMGHIGQDGSKLDPTRLQNCFPTPTFALTFSYFFSFPFPSFPFLSNGGAPVRFPFLLFLRQDLQVQVQAHLTALSVLISIFVRQMQVPFLDHFWSSFGPKFWVPLGSLFGSKSESKMGPFFEQPPDGHLEAT